VEVETNALVAEHCYDGLGRRVFKIVRKVDEQQNITYDRRDYYYNESWQTIHTDGAGPSEADAGRRPINGPDSHGHNLRPHPAFTRPLLSGLRTALLKPQSWGA